MEPYLGEIRVFGFNFAPRGWATCDGQILPINQNQSLYSLLGTTYGGDGRTSFALPDLRGRSPMHVSSSHPQGQRAGQETVTLTAAEVPSHTHSVMATSDVGTIGVPAGNVLAQDASNPYSAAPTSTLTMQTGTVTTVGGDGHNNMQPFLTVNYCIAIAGLFPPRS